MHFAPRMVAAAALAFVLVVRGESSFGQSSFVFGIQQSASNFTWTGTSSLGPIVGNPSNAFQMAGTTALDLTSTPGVQSIDGAAFNGGDALTVPDIHGKIPNILPFLPPLATIDIVGLHIALSSPSAPVAAVGAFTADVTVTALAGTLTVATIGQAPTTSPLAGSMSSPSSVAGTLSFGSGSIHLVAPIDTTFAFSDPASGASGTVRLLGTFDASFALFSSLCSGEAGQTLCPCGNASPPGSGAGCLNSTGAGAKLSASGMPRVTNDTLVLSGASMPASVATLYFQGSGLQNGGAGDVFGDGVRCAGGSIIRLATKTNVGGASSVPGPGDPLISIKGAVPSAGATRYYQAWYRNAVSFCTSDTFNVSNAMAVIWMP